MIRYRVEKIDMGKRNWKYKITGGWAGLIMASVMLALFGGLTVWLYTTRNGAFIGGVIVTAFMAIGFVLSVCSALFFKVLVDSDGFFCQTAPGNGRYYRYSEIRSMWISSGRETNARQSTYCNFETVEGKRSRFIVLDPNGDAVDYMMQQVEAAENQSEAENHDRELVISGKTQAGFQVIPLIFSLVALCLVEKLLAAQGVSLLFRVIPVIVAALPAAQVLSYGLFYKIQIQKDGFYCRTNPFNGCYYRYSDITDCRLIETQKKFGSVYQKGVRETHYFYYLQFIDRAHQTRRILYDKSLFEGEINELVARMERAHRDENEAVPPEEY